MSDLKRLSFLLFLFFCLTFTAVASAVDSSSPGADDAKFQELLAQVEETELHAVLHSWSNKFKDGVFSKDRTAIEHVHSENAQVATKLVKLAKKAVSNTTASATPESATKTDDTTKTPVKSETTTTTNSDISTKLVAASTPSNVAAVSTESDGGVVVSVTTGSGSKTTLSSSTAVVSYAKSTHTYLQTTTLPDGQASVITSVTVVTGESTLATAVAGETAAASGSNTPTLQTSASMKTSENLQTALAMLCAFAVALFSV
ncbi:putative a-agglutinin-like core protein aga1 [Phaeomoniella chlamydospora]|uniref:Putative a-agglutinin-like core protein aga1 n=1 Tax=Phaeomoniella chlamydospora TaxID=158046 RepID=A0A0G2FPS5_PHACM|nr:putative a-agglutinin-like core protein aga1 [Phaeomoniella chlamydospora]